MSLTSQGERHVGRRRRGHVVLVVDLHLGHRLGQLHLDLDLGLLLRRRLWLMLLRVLRRMLLLGLGLGLLFLLRFLGHLIQLVLVVGQGDGQVVVRAPGNGLHHFHIVAADEGDL